MKAISVRLLLFLNRLFPRLNINDGLEKAKRSSHEYFDAEMREGVFVLEESGSDLVLAGKRILDLGSGLGGKTCLYARLGARRAIGLDIRPASIRVARDILQASNEESNNRVSYVLGDAAALPLEDSTVDVIITVNVFEHLDDPQMAFLECARVLSRGGRVLIRFSPWYSPWAPHLNRWINLPWPHLFFSDEVLIAASLKVEEQRRMSEALIETAQIDLRGKKRLPDLNRLTVAQFRRLMRKAPFRIVKFELLPFGYDFLRRRGRLGNSLLWGVRVLLWMPVLREVITTKILCVLEKE
jgi:SAM-dependent methyltransferase